MIEERHCRVCGPVSQLPIYDQKFDGLMRDIVIILERKSNESGFYYRITLFAA